ncbi:hypothetical protein ORM86_23020 [Bacillus cereus]|nr:hypothetical protein [Bacillus cereus]HDR6293994.1 hypothetical protein [Bacillus cereus]
MKIELELNAPINGPRPYLNLGLKLSAQNLLNNWLQVGLRIGQLKV